MTDAPPRNAMVRLLAIGLPVLLVAVGLVAGYGLAVLPMRSQIQHHRRGERLGWLVDEPDERAALALAYQDVARVPEAIDDYCWAVPTTLAPFVGHGPRPGLHGNATINARQCRDKRAVTMPKPPNTFRIFVTGGSAAFGSGAPSQDAILGAVLERLLNRATGRERERTYEVFTLASPAWASTHERILIANRLSELAPDLVLSYSGVNDIHWAEKGRDILWFRSYADDHYRRLVNTARQRSGFARLPDVIAIDKDKVAPARVAERLAKNVRLARYALSLERATYVFALQPSLFTTAKPLTERERDELRSKSKPYFMSCTRAIDARLSAFDLEGFAYVNLCDVFDAGHDNEELFIDNYHVADKGTRIIAERLAQELEAVLAADR